MNSIEFIDTTIELIRTLTPEQRGKFISIIKYLNKKKIQRDTRIYKKVKGKVK